MRAESDLTYPGLISLLAMLVVVSALAIPPLGPLLAPLVFP